MCERVYVGVFTLSHLGCNNMVFWKNLLTSGGTVPEQVWGLCGKIEDRCPNISVCLSPLTSIHLQEK
jgi:hypothetical protein